MRWCSNHSSRDLATAMSSEHSTTPHPTIECPRWELADGAEAARELLALGPPPKAQVCMNDSMDLGANREFHRAGYSVADDISVVSFDDDLIAHRFEPQLSTVAPPNSQMGDLAALRGDGLAARLLLDTETEPKEHLISMPVQSRSSICHLETDPQASIQWDTHPEDRAQPASLTVRFKIQKHGFRPAVPREAAGLGSPCLSPAKLRVVHSFSSLCASCRCRATAATVRPPGGGSGKRTLDQDSFLTSRPEATRSIPFPRWRLVLCSYDSDLCRPSSCRRCAELDFYVARTES